MVKKIIILCLITNIALANLIQFQPNTPIQANQLNSNFNHIKNILQSRNVPVNFSTFSSGQLILNQSLENEFDKVRNLNISVSPLDLVQIKAAELNNAFSQMEAGATVVDDIPSTSSASFSINEDSQYVGVLSYVNQTGASNIIVVSPPSNGNLAIGSNGSFTYSPNLNYNGNDSFSFKVNDGNNDSNTSIVSITVNPVNDQPVAIAQSLITNEDNALNITLSGTDIENDNLSYTIVAQPTNGTLSGTGSSQIYTPSSNFNGTDSFTFKINDGQLDSVIQTISITVSPINDIPVAIAQSLSTNEDTALNITLSGTDLDNNPLTYTIVAQPNNGTLSGTGSSRIYTPSSNFNGTDSFTFKVNDGVIDSATQTVNITVNSINDAPVVSNLTGTTPEDTAFSINLSATDPDSSSFTYSIVSQATSGAASIVGNTLTYVPNLNTSGNFVITYRANDGQANSNNATLTVNVTAVWPTGSDGALNITSGTTTLAAGSVRNYSSINIAAGATLNISGSSNAITIIGSSGPVVINGNITVTNTALGTSTATATTPDGRSLSYTQTRMPGGSGGAGGSYTPRTTVCNDGAPGGSQSAGRGGGGGGGGGSLSCGYVSTAGSSTSTDSTLGVGGGGGTGGDGGAGAGGTGGGNPGGRGGHGSGRGGGGGGGGGYVGRHGLSLFIKSKGSISGSGLINLGGLSGFSGGGGGVSNGCPTCSNQGGGGGGGGSGGSAGNLWIVSPSFSVNYNILGGNGGAGGNGGGNSSNCSGTNSCDGAPGSNGQDGVVNILTYP